MDNGRLLDPFSTPEVTERKCDYCDNVAVNASPDPFAEEIYGDHTDKHFCCASPTCEAEWERTLRDSADDI